MRTLTPAIFHLAFAIALHAATPEELQFQQLKQQRAKAPAGASEMLDQRYRTSLEQMLKLPGLASQQELARQIQAELQATAGAKAAGAATATPKPLSAPAGRTVTKSELKKLFENSQWRVTQPSRGKDAVYFTFTKEGKFAQSVVFERMARYQYWEVTAPDVLKVSIHDPDKNRKSPFRAFRVVFEHKTARTDATLGGDPGTDLTIEYDQPLDRKK